MLVKTRVLRCFYLGEFDGAVACVILIDTVVPGNIQGPFISFADYKPVHYAPQHY